MLLTVCVAAYRAKRRAFYAWTLMTFPIIPLAASRKSSRWNKQSTSVFDDTRHSCRNFTTSLMTMAFSSFKSLVFDLLGNTRISFGE